MTTRIIDRKIENEPQPHTFKYNIDETKFYGIEAYLHSYYMYNPSLLAPIKIHETKGIS